MFKFGAFRFDPTTMLLFKGDEPLGLGRRGALLLAALLRRPGEVVTKGELIEAAWPGVSIEDSNLSVQIATVRKLLAEAGDETDWIATVARVGYRFVSRQQAQPPETAAASRLPSLVVLPFANMSGEAAQDYFADGIVEDLTTAFAQFKSLTVLSRNSAFLYRGRAVDARQVAAELGASYLLEGSVRRAGDRLRVTAQLIEGATGKHLWAGNFDGVIAEIFNVQDSIVDSVVAVVEPSIMAVEIERSRRERPGSIDAWDLYLRGTYRMKTNTPDDNAEAIRLFDEALKLEPDNGQYLGGAASALQHGVSMGWPWIGPEHVRRLIEVSMHGLRRVTDDAEALALFGLGLVDAKEQDLGYATLVRAFEVNPNSMMAVNCLGIGALHLGSIDDAEGYFQRALRLNPRDPEVRFALTGLAHVEMIRGDYEAALKWAQRSATITDGFGATDWMLIAANAHLGRMDEARRHLAHYLTITPGMTIARIIVGQPNREPDRIASIVEGMRLAGLPER